MNMMSRRGVLQLSGGGLLASAATFGGPRQAAAADALTVVEWGPPYLNAAKEIMKTSSLDINWVLHVGGAAGILPKIKTAWPDHVPYDVVDSFSGVTDQMIAEGWLAPITFADVPNLKNVPPKLIMKDQQGNMMNVPHSLNGFFFVYRTDTCPIPIKTIDDFLNPKLKGLIAWPTPTLGGGAQLVALALAKGGNERNMEPAWDFLKKMAKAGNIGRVVNTSIDGQVSLTTGETAVTFTDQVGGSAIAKRVPTTFLTKTDPSIKTFLTVDGWVVMKSSKNKKAAFAFVDATITPDANQVYARQTGMQPTNVHAQATPGLEYLSFTQDELEKYTFDMDYRYVASQMSAWQTRFETEIQPLL